MNSVQILHNNTPNDEILVSCLFDKTEMLDHFHSFYIKNDYTIIFYSNQQVWHFIWHHFQWSDLEMIIIHIRWTDGLRIINHGLIFSAIKGSVVKLNDWAVLLIRNIKRYNNENLILTQNVKSWILYDFCYLRLRIDIFYKNFITEGGIFTNLSSFWQSFSRKNLWESYLNIISAILCVIALE